MPSQREGPHRNWRYRLGPNGDLDLVDVNDAKGETLYLALLAKNGDLSRPDSVSADDPKKVDGDKLSLALGKRQKAPAPESRRVNLQSGSGVWYVELRRAKPSESNTTKGVANARP